METRFCKKCNIEHPFTKQYFGFYKHKGRIEIVCRACVNRRHKFIPASEKTHYEYVEPSAGKTKMCTTCKQELPASKIYFYGRATNKDGLRNQCIVCERGRKYRIKDEFFKVCGKCKQKLPITREFFYFIKRGKNRTEHVCISCARERGKESRANRDIDAEREKRRRYYQQNAEKIKRKASLWVKENRDRHALHGATRRSLKENVDATFTIKQRGAAWEYFGNSCAYCGSKERLTEDHVVPLSRGGEYTHNNIIPACKKCNCSKHNEDMFEWYKKSKHFSQKRFNKILSFLNYTKDGTQQLVLPFL